MDFFFCYLVKTGKFVDLFKPVGPNPPKPPVSPTFRKPIVDEQNCCVFPPDNLDLMYGDWEKDIILDAQVKYSYKIL